MSHRLTALSAIVELNPGLPRLSPDQAVSFLPMAAISEDGYVTYQEERLFADVERGYTLFKRNDILLAKITPCMENGKAAYLDQLNQEWGAGSTEFHVVRPGPDVDGKYLFFMLWNPLFRHIAEKRMTGSAGQKRVPVGFLKEFEIPLLSLPEQRRIAAILGKADAIRRKRREALKLADEFLRAVFFDLFGDPVSNPRNWPVVELGKHLTFMTSGSRGWAEYYAEAGDRFLRIQNVGNNRLLLEDLAHVTPPESAEARRTLALEGDVLLSITADLGRTATIPAGFGKAYINQHLALLRVQGFVPQFVSAYLDSKGGQTQFTRLNRGGVKAGLNFDDIRSLKILQPPIGLQQRYELAYSKARVMESRLQTQLAEAETLFQSLSHRAFQGTL